MYLFFCELTVAVIYLIWLSRTIQLKKYRNEKT